MIRHRFIRIAAITGVSAVLSHAAINRSVNTKRDHTAAPIRQVCLISVEAQLSRFGMKGIEPLLPEGDEWAKKLRETVTKAVAGTGWGLAGDLSDLNPSDNEQLRQNVLRIKQKYDTVAVQLDRKPGQIGKGRYTLGDEVALLPCAANADSLLLVQASGMLQTTGRKVFSIAVYSSMGPLMAQARYTIRVAFVDAKTGEVTALTRIGLTGGSVGRDPDKVLTARLVEEFKKTHPAAKP